MQHARHFVTVAIAVAAIAVPAIIFDPAAQSIVAHHPILAAYFPLVTGIVSAIARAYRTYKASHVDAVASSGAPTMGAK